MDSLDRKFAAKPDKVRETNKRALDLGIEYAKSTCDLRYGKAYRKSGEREVKVRFTYHWAIVISVFHPYGVERRHNSELLQPFP